MVEWERFRPSGGTGGTAVYDYGSHDERLLAVADGGTLWLVTRRQGGGAVARYHLAYKLVECTQVDPHGSLFSGSYRYVVRARDWARSRHFRYNDATGTLWRLSFSPAEPAAGAANDLERRLQSVPELTSADVALLERLQHKIERGRAVFVSYSHEDSAFASTLELELGERHISVSRDVVFLEPGHEWERALQQEVSGTDCFVVLVSSNAAGSEWVRREIGWALREYEEGGLVKAIIPIALPSGGGGEFPELVRFQHWRFPASGEDRAGFDKLAEGIVSARERER